MLFDQPSKMKLVKAFRKSRFQCLGLFQMGEQSTVTLHSRIFSSNGAQQQFAYETQFHASFYCRNISGTSFVKGPLSYADSLVYCENYDGTLGELDDDFGEKLISFQSHPFSKRSTGKVDFPSFGRISKEPISHISSSGINEPTHILPAGYHLLIH